MACSGGDDQLMIQRKRVFVLSIIVTAGTMGAADIVAFIARLIGGLAVQTVLNDASGWLLALAPVGGTLVFAYHWFTSGLSD